MSKYYMNFNGTLPLNLGGDNKPLLVPVGFQTPYHENCCCGCSCLAQEYQQVQVQCNFKYILLGRTRPIRGNLSGTMIYNEDACSWVGGSGIAERQTRTGQWEYYADITGSLSSSSNGSAQFYGDRCFYRFVITGNRSELAFGGDLYFPIDSFPIPPFGGYQTCIDEGVYEECSGTVNIS